MGRTCSKSILGKLLKKISKRGIGKAGKAVATASSGVQWRKAGTRHQIKPKQIQNSSKQFRGKGGGGCTTAPPVHKTRQKSWANKVTTSSDDEGSSESSEEETSSESSGDERSSESSDSGAEYSSDEVEELSSDEDDNNHVEENRSTRLFSRSGRWKHPVDKIQETNDVALASDLLEYVVERILKHKVLPNGKRRFFLQWRGSWVDEEDMDCKEAIREYFSELKTKERRKKKSHRHRAARDRPTHYYQHPPASGQALLYNPHCFGGNTTTGAQLHNPHFQHFLPQPTQFFGGNTTRGGQLHNPHFSGFITLPQHSQFSGLASLLGPPPSPFADFCGVTPAMVSFPSPLGNFYGGTPAMVPPPSPQAHFSGVPPEMGQLHLSGLPSFNGSAPQVGLSQSPLLIMRGAAPAMGRKSRKQNNLSNPVLTQKEYNCTILDEHYYCSVPGCRNHTGYVSRRNFYRYHWSQNHGPEDMINVPIKKTGK